MLNTNSDLMAEDRGFNKKLSIKIIGVGGAGCKVLERLQFSFSESIGLFCLDTDFQTLQKVNRVSNKSLIGERALKGLGAGGDPEQGKLALDESFQIVNEVVSGADIIFIISGLGGGTGSGIVPDISRAGMQEGAFVINFALLPFSFEGKRRTSQSEEALLLLRTNSHAAIPLSNDLVFQLAGENDDVLEAFSFSDQWIQSSIEAICYPLIEDSLISLRLSDLGSAFCDNPGRTLFSLGRARGSGYVKEALKDLFTCPVLHLPEFSKRADRLLVSIRCGQDLKIESIQEIVKDITAYFGNNESDIQLGVSVDSNEREFLEISIIGSTDLDEGKQPRSNESSQGEPLDYRASTQLDRFLIKKKPAKKKLKPRSKTSEVFQEEFDFLEEEAQRGVFEMTDSNLVGNEDLDIPTYLRRGVKIVF